MKVFRTSKPGFQPTRAELQFQNVFRVIDCKTCISDMCLFNCLPYRKILFPESKVKLTLISPKLSDRSRRKSNVLPNSGPTLCTRCGKSCSCSATWRERLSDTKSKRCPRTFFTDKICPTLTWRISSNSSTDLIPEVTSRL